MTDPQKAAEALLHDYYAVFNSGNREAMLALLTEDVVHDINQGGTETGRAAFQAFFLADGPLLWVEQVEELVVFASADGSRGAAEFYISGTYLSADEGLPPATGQTYRLRVGAFFDLREGKVARVTNYYNLQDWLTQVGAR